MSNMTEKFGLRCGDKIIVIEDAGEYFVKDSVIQIARDDGDAIPWCIDTEEDLLPDYFDLDEGKWKRYEESPKLPLKRDDKITLELTGEEVFWIKALTGNCNGTFATSSLYDKVEHYFEHPLGAAVGYKIDLYGRSAIVNEVLSETFEPEVEELTLEEICEQLGKNIKIVKNKEA